MNANRGNIEVKGTRVVEPRVASKIPDLQLEDHDRYSPLAKRCHVYTERENARACPCRTASTYAPSVCSRASDPTTLIARYQDLSLSLSLQHLFTSRAPVFGLPCLHALSLSNRPVPKRMVKLDSNLSNPSPCFDSSVDGCTRKKRNVFEETLLRDRLNIGGGIIYGGGTEQASHRGTRVHSP